VLEDVDFVVGDVADGALINFVVRCRAITHILHGAAIVADQADVQPIGAIRVNIEGTLNTLEAARLFDLERVVVISSSSVNGTHAGHPLKTP
jgi:nucleoside-diphosphate-sugar epimerase